MSPSTEEKAMTDYDYKAHRKACIEKALDDGNFEKATCARKYDLCDDGQWHLKADSWMWFPTHINICDFEK